MTETNSGKIRAKLSNGVCGISETRGEGEVTFSFASPNVYPCSQR